MFWQFVKGLDFTPSSVEEESAIQRDTGVVNQYVQRNKKKIFKIGESLNIISCPKKNQYGFFRISLAWNLFYYLCRVTSKWHFSTQTEAVCSARVPPGLCLPLVTAAWDKWRLGVCEPCIMILWAAWQQENVSHVSRRIPNDLSGFQSESREQWSYFKLVWGKGRKKKEKKR